MNSYKPDESIMMSRNIDAILSKPCISTKHDFTGGRKKRPCFFLLIYFNVFFADNCILYWETR